MQKLKSLFSKNEFIKNIVVVLGGNVTAKLLTFLVMPVLTRLYLPEDFGVFAIFSSILGVAATIVTLRYFVAIPIASNSASAHALIKLCLFVVFLITFLIATVLVFFSDFVIGITSAHNIKPYLWVLPLGVFSIGIFQTLQGWAIREKEFASLTKSAIAQSVGSAITKTSIGFMGINSLGLLAGLLVQEIIGALLLLNYFVRKKVAFTYDLSWFEIKRVALRYKMFPMVQSWSQLLLGLGAQMPVLLIGYFFGLEVAGFFALAQTVVSVPMMLVGQSVSQVYYAEISNYGKNEQNKIHDLSVKVIKKLMLLAFFPICVLMLFGPYFFVTIFGEIWETSGDYARCLSLILFMQFITSPISNIFNLYEKQFVQLNMNLLRFVFICFVFWASNYLEYSIEKSIILYSIILSLHRLGVLYYCLKIIRV